MRRVGAVVAVIGLLAALAACGDGNGGQRAETARSSDTLEVTSEVVSHETTQDVFVFAPEDGGPWPVVVAFHGINGTALDMAALATRVAGEGFVVFAPTYRTDVFTEEGREQAALDGECGYRFARSIAGRYGGDLEQPVTFVGWSLGASLGLVLGLTEELDPTGEVLSCFGAAPRPDIVVGISGCHYESDGRKTGYLDYSQWTNKDADIVLVGGERDANCEGWQTEDAADELRSAGFDVELTMLEGATHFGPVFHKSAGDGMVVDRDATAGERTVEIITDAFAARRGRG